MYLRADNCEGQYKSKEYIAEKLKGIIEEVGRHNVVQIITDNAANCKGAGLIVESEYDNIFSLLENRLKAPVAKSLWYRVKQSVPKPSKFTQNILFGWDLNSRPLASHVAPLPSQLHSCSDREGDIFLLK